MYANFCLYLKRELMNIFINIRSSNNKIKILIDALILNDDKCCEMDRFLNHFYKLLDKNSFGELNNDIPSITHCQIF